MNVFRFRTNLFFTDQPDDQLDQWFLGGDCAAWFFMRLMAEEELEYCCCPTMEDWGWTMAVKCFEIQVWFMIYREEDVWAFIVETRKGFLQRKFYEHQATALEKTMRTIESIARSDNRFNDIGWSGREPFAPDPTSQQNAGGNE